jgi:hypothetical protein
MFMEKADTDLYERQGSGVFNEDKAKNYSAQIARSNHFDYLFKETQYQKNCDYCPF